MANFQFGNPVSGYGQHLNREENTHQEQSERTAVYDAFKINKNLTAARNQYEPALTAVIEPLARNMAASMGELWQREYNGNTYTEKLSIEMNRYNQQLEFALQDNSTKLSFQITADNGNFYISGLNTYDFNSRQSNVPLTENQKTAVGALLAHQELQPYFSQNAVNQMYGMLGQEAQKYINPNPQYQGNGQQNISQHSPAPPLSQAPQQENPQQNSKPNYFINSKTEQEKQQAPEFIQLGLDRITPLAEEIHKNITWKNSGISKAGKPYEMTPNPSVTVSRAIAKEKQGNTWTDKTDNNGNPVYRTDKTNNFVYDASISVTESNGDTRNSISFYLNSDKIKCNSPDMIERIYARNFTENMQGLLQNMWQNGMITQETKTGANIQPFMQYLVQNVPQQSRQSSPVQQLIADAVKQGIQVSQENTPQQYQQNPQNQQQNNRAASYGNNSNLYEQIKATHNYVAFAKDTYGQNDPFIQNGVQKASDFAQEIANAMHNQGLMPTYQKQDGTTAESKIVVSVRPATGQFATDKNNNQRYSSSLMLKDGSSAVFLNLGNTLQYEPKITGIGQSQGGISDRLQAVVNFVQSNGYMYEKNQKPITATQNTAERPQINIAEQVNRNDPFIMQGVEVMKQLAEQLQQNGIRPTIFVNKHGEPPVYMAKMMVRDQNTMLNLYVSDKVLKNAIDNHTQPTFYDFGGYDLKTRQQSMEVLTPALQQIVQNVQKSGLVQNTELQNIAAQYNRTHQDTYAVYHHLGDTYQKFGKPTVCNSEMIELRSRNGSDIAVPMVCVRPDGKTDIAIMDNEQQKIGMLASSRQMETYLKGGKLNPETIQLIAEIKNFIPVQQEQTSSARNPVIAMHRSMTDFYNSQDNKDDAWKNSADLVGSICNSIETNPEALNVSPDNPIKSLMKSAYDIYQSAGKDAVVKELTETYIALGNLTGADKAKYDTPAFRSEFFGADDANHKISSFETPQQRGDDYLRTVTVKASIDPVSYQQKPVGYEIGNIKNRLGTDRNAQVQEYTIGQILNATNDGHTVCLADVDTSQGSHKADGFQSQQLYYVDIDNSKETVNKEHIRLTQEEGYLSFEQAMQKCQENNINVLYSYDSFSYQQDFERFRLAVLLPEPVTSIQEHEKIVKGLSSVFGQAADQKCFNGDRIFFGTNPQTSHGIRFVADSNQQQIYTDKKIILDLYEKNVGSIQHYSPYQEQEVEGQMDLFSSAPPEKESAESLLHTLAETGYFNIPRSFEEVRQDLQSAGDEISDTDLKNLLENMNIELIQEESQQNQPKKEQIQYGE